LIRNVQIQGLRSHKNQGTDERSKGRSKAIALIMLYKEEEDEVSLLFVNDCFYDKRNAEVVFIDKH
jgi:hypothetical protein